MNATRPTLARRLLGLTAVPALLVGLAACGDDDDSAGGGNFCDTARDIDDAFGNLDLAEGDTSAIADVAETMGSVEPPAEIADDWATMESTLDAMADIDFTDPEAAEQVDVLSDAEDAFNNVGTYAEEECGIEGAGG